MTRAIDSLRTEGLLGAFLTGLMVLVFLRDWRSALVVVLNIPLAIMAALVGLWLCGQTINLMTLGGLALAVGILVDEATVEIENIHTQFEHSDSIARAVRQGNLQTAVPRLLAMLCILAVFVPSFFMQGAARGLFVPLSLAVGFSMIASYILSSTFVPVLSVWLLQIAADTTPRRAARRSFFDHAPRAATAESSRRQFGGGSSSSPRMLPLGAVFIVFVGSRWERRSFPTGTSANSGCGCGPRTARTIDQTEQIALAVLDTIRDKVGADKIAITLGYVGVVPRPIRSTPSYQWSRGPEEAILRVALKPGSGGRHEAMKERSARNLPNGCPMSDSRSSRPTSSAR